MTIHVLFFAALAHDLNHRAMSLTLADHATVAEALDKLTQIHLALGPWRPQLAVAVNDAYVALDHVLSQGDELALIPPVSGG